MSPDAALMQSTTNNDTTRFRETYNAAQAGDSTAQFNLGLMYANGVGVEQDFSKALFWYHKAADRGNPAAEYILAGKYASGQGVEQDLKQALTWYLRASSRGYARAIFRLGQLLNVPHEQFAEDCFRQAAEKGLPDAQVAIGNRIVAAAVGAGETLPEQALDLYVKAAEAGSASAQYRLGTYYENGKIGDAPDLPQALTWFRKAARQGFSAAQTRLGCLYALGEGVAKDNRQAFTWFSRAAEQGDGEAQFQLALMYESGTGVEADPAQADLWYARAAEKGNPSAQLHIGRLREENNIDDEAASWYRMAADNGNTEALLRLSGMYAEGRGVPHDVDRAFTCLLEAAERAEPSAYLALAEWIDREGVTLTTAWYRKAAELSVVEAQYILANRLMRGQGTKEDQFEAVSWYLKAAESGLPEAEFALGEIFMAKSPSQENLAEAASWYRTAAKKGFAPAQAALGALYAQGTAVPKDYKQASAWWLKAAEQGNIEAQYQVAQLFERGLAGPVAKHHAEHWYQRAAEQGNDERAMIALAEMHRQTAPEKAEKILRKLAERQVAQAQLDLARILQNKAKGALTSESLSLLLLAAGQGNREALARLTELNEHSAEHMTAMLASMAGLKTPPPPSAVPEQTATSPAAIKRERQRPMAASSQRVSQQERSEHARVLAEADQGNPAALWKLGSWHIKGDHGVVKNLETAHNCFFKAAQAGFAPAQAALALMLSSGNGCPQDRKQAIYWWTKAAEQGDPESQYNLGMMYDKGVGVPADAAAAADWIRKAAEQGIVIAQIRLGLLNATGRLGSANLVEAYAWFSVAARSGNDAAQANREHAESMLNAQEVREGQRRADALVKQINKAMKS
ncbi:tetratricopeptide repeat protein [Propionivibrio dicarboxylicus]|uniref:TPR repeat n=1 Tax=Propionivibrio dicarboxylicus TaxID=83767 RepID=A0A1G8H9A4_9RHOO|nr:tetratricopeptide repeat protein [Propionivibrio dicarboxylicus]SDI03215.1 TPR repeat [Propionivibrio dicarboxylicus]